MNNQQVYSRCDSEKLDALLLGTLSTEEATAVEAHLSECSSCAEQIQLAAVPGTSWNEAQSMLAFDEFDGPPSLSSLSSLFPVDLDNTSTADLLTREIRGWLDPTDDPQMLGRFAGYEIVGIVGHGGMGIVLKGFEASLNRYVAIKVLAPRLATNGSARQRFAREAQAAAAVLHENVVAIHRVDEFHGLPFLVMPYVAGISLQRRIDDEGPLQTTAVLRIGSQIAAGLAAAHHQGLVHRDIKPANILLDKGVERVTITDFGLARAIDDATVTQTGIIAGTPQYMSPEQAQAKPLDARSDLFSLGSVLYAICTGRPPFRAETSHAVMRRITDEGPTSIREINPGVPDWLCQIVAKLMSKRPEDRFDSANEVAELFEDCLAHVQQPTTVPLPESRLLLRKQSVSFTERTTTNFRKLGVIAMIAAFGFGLLGLFLLQSTTPPDISGKWTGEDWGQVVLEEKRTGQYDGTYTDTFGEEDGKLQLRWSRIEGRFKGTWREGKDRFGKISVRLVDDEIRGAWTTSKGSGINPGTPELADLLWIRSSAKDAATKAPAATKVPATVDSASEDQNLPQTQVKRRSYMLQFSGRHGTHLVIPKLRYDGSHPMTFEAIVMSLYGGSIIGDFNGSGLGLGVASGLCAFHVNDGRTANNGYASIKSRTRIRYRVSTGYEKPVHIAGVLDGSELRLFVDGKLQGSETIGKFNKSKFPFMIGADPGGQGEPTKFLNGIIDEVRVSKTARYGEDFAPPSTLDCDKHTMVLYRFDEGEGDVANDSSGNALHAKIHGARWVAVKESTETFGSQTTQLLRLFGAKITKKDGVITEILLAHSLITDADLAGIESIDSLERLTVFGCVNVTDRSFARLKNLPHLKVLNAAPSNITDVGVENLKGLKGLWFLSLNGTKVTDVGLKHLIDNSKIAVLYLNGTKITDEGLVFLEQMKDMHSLDLGATAVTDAGLAHLGHMSKLNQLHLSGSAVTDAGMEHVSRLSNISSLRLNNTSISDAGLVHLAKLPKLMDLQVLNTKVTQKGIDALKRALPNVTVRHDKFAATPLHRILLEHHLFDSRRAKRQNEHPSNRK